jgi:hypothetical protein
MARKSTRKPRKSTRKHRKPKKSTRKSTRKPRKSTHNPRGGKIHVKLSRSSKADKKWMVTIDGKKTIHFGQAGASDYTIHKDASRMVRYVRRHGGSIPSTVSSGIKNGTMSNSQIKERMKSVTTSSKENWGIGGVKTAGFWSRWLLWSTPSIASAKSLIRSKFPKIILK